MTRTPPHIPGVLAAERRRLEALGEDGRAREEYALVCRTMLGRGLPTPTFDDFQTAMTTTREDLQCPTT